MFFGEKIVDIFLSNSYLIISTVFELIFLLLHKRWFKNSFSALIYGMFILGSVPHFILTFDNVLLCLIQIVVCIFSFSVCIYYIFSGLKYINNVGIIKDFRIIIFFTFDVIFLLILLFNNMLKSVPEFFGVVGLVVLTPLFEELLCREIVFKMLNSKSMKKYLLITLIYSLIIVCFHYKSKAYYDVRLYYIQIFILFYGLFILRYFMRNKKMYLCIFIHQLYNIFSVCLYYYITF